MNKNELAAFLILREVYDLEVDQGYIDLTDRKRLQKAKRGAVSKINADLEAVTMITAEELCRSAGICSYLDGRDHEYILCEHPTAQRFKQDIFDADLPGLHPLRVYKKANNTVYSGNDLDELLFTKSKLRNSESVVVVRTNLRNKYVRVDPRAHSHLNQRLTPSFNYFSQYSSPHAAIAAAKIVACGDLVGTAEYVSGITFEQFKKTRKVIEAVESRMTRSSLHT